MKTRMISIAMGVLLISVTLAGAANSRIRNSAASGHENITEQTLTLENWMVNECYWTCMHYNCLGRDYDEALTLDSWMTELNNWDYAVYLPKEGEESLEVESWMTDENLWSGKQQGVDPEKEKKLQLESWMTDPASWQYTLLVPAEVEDRISLDSWMTDDHVWSNEFSEMVLFPVKQ